MTSDASRRVSPRGSRFVGLAACASLAALVLGCIPIGDPGGPGARGVVKLGKGIELDDFSSLRFQAVPASDEFDPKAPDFPDEVDFASGYYHDLSELKFPFSYEYGGGLGTTEHKHWRLFVWLSRADADGSDEEAHPVHGAPYGVVDYSLEGCGAYGDYCGISSGVDVTLDQVAP
jgi:hypothetical protein